jgi:glycerol-3-phosphate acyltransferase PlsY
MIYLLAFLLGYLPGSIPFGLILTRAAGLGDIRAIGSGNIGATNVLRTGNRKLAAATLLLDGLKGAVGVYLGSRLGLPEVGGLGAVIGHLYPCWLRFRGGKGVATAFGVLIAAAWPVGLAACAVWLAVAWSTRISSAAGLSAFAAAPFLALIFGYRAPALLAFIIALLVFLRHNANIRRLIEGTEPRMSAPKS